MRTIPFGRRAIGSGHWLGASMLTLAMVVLGCPDLYATDGGEAQGTDISLCADVHKIVAMRPVSFTPVRGFVDGPPSEDGFQFYNTQFILAGAETCKVWSDQQDRGWGYECNWHVVDPASAERQFRLLTDLLSACYPQARTYQPWAGRFLIEGTGIKIRFRDGGRLSGIVLTISGQF
jgi:hypothetical protein